LVLILAQGVEANTCLCKLIGEVARWSSKPEGPEGYTHARKPHILLRHSLVGQRHTANVLSQRPLLTSGSLSTKAATINCNPTFGLSDLGLIGWEM